MPMNIHEIYERHIKVLPVADRLRLVELIQYGLSALIGSDLPPSHSLLELEGLRAEMRPGIGAQAYVDELHGEWD